MARVARDPRLRAIICMWEREREMGDDKLKEDQNVPSSTKVSWLINKRRAVPYQKLEPMTLACAWYKIKFKPPGRKDPNKWMQMRLKPNVDRD